MSFDYDELWSRFTSYLSDGTADDLIYLLEADFDNWLDHPDGGHHLSALHGLLSHDEALWMYSQLTEA